MTAIRPRLAIFARAPVRGQVKTRLAKSVGADRALEVYERLVASTLRKLAPGSGRFVSEVWLEGVAPASVFEGFRVIPQPSGDLGSRMAAAFESGVSALVGTDIPAMTANYVDQALDALTVADLVIGPVVDGGYCLIAMNAPHPALFDGIPWSTGRVVTETLAVAKRLSLAVTMLDELWDVDDEADLRRWQLQQGEHTPQPSD